jgi:uncharacterized protein (DUF1697 family)
VGYGARMATTTYVALLRGINVGSSNRLPMQTLREILGGMGSEAVRTHLQSGNALFDHAPAEPARLATELRDGIAGELGLTVPCIVREAAELREVIERNPYDMAGIDPARFLVAFLSGPVDPGRLKDLDPAAYAPDSFRPGEREIYVHCPDGIQKTKLSHTLWEKRLGLTATARNWNTVTRLAELAGV